MPIFLVFHLCVHLSADFSKDSCQLFRSEVKTAALCAEVAKPYNTKDAGIGIKRLFLGDKPLISQAYIPKPAVCVEEK